jgi:hypothetical protein
MTVFSRRLAWCGAAISIVACAVVVMAQGRNDITDAGSFAALTAEIQQLRLAVEESTRSQAQTQALGVYLSAQQARLVQVATRVDVARKELDAVTLRSREIAARLANIADLVPRIADPRERAELEEQTRALKMEQDSIAFKEQQARSRDAELSQMLQFEDARWTDLISKLEQLVKR